MGPSLSQLQFLSHWCGCHVSVPLLSLVLIITAALQTSRRYLFEPRCSLDKPPRPRRNGEEQWQHSSTTLQLRVSVCLHKPEHETLLMQNQPVSVQLSLLVLLQRDLAHIFLLRLLQMQMLPIHQDEAQTSPPSGSKAAHV